ncbi:MAG: heterodisulfide reductase-related iron-sulfur binding cluster [Coriobacteriia bacterium]|nr:heterodisulfide reductase-related iron-sulfur binding cluster [Coriobacteriia bacterium]
MSKEDLRREVARPYRMDLEPNFYSLLREELGFAYSDALDAGEAAPTRGQGLSLFWPGCSLASYSQELTLAVARFLEERGLSDGLSINCCGNIVRYAGGYEVFLDFTARLVARLKEQRVRRLIIGCPNCYLTFLQILKDAPEIELLDLTTVLVQEGLRVADGQALSFCIHDSCPDKRLQVFAPAVRTLFEGLELREMPRNRRNSPCCGLGKLRFICHPQDSERLCEERITEFKETGAHQLVACCASCASAFQDPDADVAALHYLELLFGIRIDWGAVFAASRQTLEAMP